MTDNIQIIENNDLNTLNKEILKFTILVTHFETQPNSLYMIFFASPFTVAPNARVNPNFKMTLDTSHNACLTMKSLYF